MSPSWGPADTVKTSPPPSQSDEVMIGGWVCVNNRLAKNSFKDEMVAERSRSRAALYGVLALRCGMVRRNSGVWYFFWMGKVLGNPPCQHDTLQPSGVNRSYRSVRRSENLDRVNV